MDSSDRAAEPIPGAASWWLARQHPPPRRPRKDGLTVNAIVETALDIVRADGADALTMRRVADEMGTGAGSLYRHVNSREELIALIVDHILGTIDHQPPAEAGWRAALENDIRRFRAHLIAHLEVVPLIRSAQMLGPNSMAAREAALRQLNELGVPPAEAVAAYLAIVHFTVANVQLDVRANAQDPDAQRTLHGLFASQDEQHFPTVVANADTLAAHSSDAEFEFGLAALMDGIAKAARPTT